MRSTLAAVVAVVALVPTAAGCSSDGSGTGSSSKPSSSSSGSSSGPAQQGTAIDIVVKNGTVTPSGDRVKASVGAPITLHIDADTAGEIHVHSSPEQEIRFPSGTSTRRLTVDKPGIIDVEDHALEKVIVQLQVS
jgi:hypothetical protein